MIGIAGCSDGSTAPPTAARHLEVVGRLERGLAVRFVAVGADDTTSVAGPSVTVTPASAAIVVGDSLRFVAAGPVKIVARIDDTSISLDTTIAAPPSIVFDGLANGNRDIYRVDLDGQNLSRLTTSPGDDSHPSANAVSIVFTSYRDGNAELYTIRPDGTNEHRLSATAANETAPALAPNGAAIAYVSDATGFARVWTASNTFTNPAQLTAGDPASSESVESGVAWSPMSDKLVISSTASARVGLFVIAAQGGAPQRLGKSGDFGPEVEPSWSASGASITYASARGDTTSIYVRDVATGIETRVVFDLKSCGQPAWLPDGRIVFTDFGSGAPTLKWVDPLAPSALHTIALPGLTAQRAAALPLR